MMKKSTFGVALAFIAAAAGVLTAVALYLRRREKELDEYERLLYSDNEFDDDEDEDTIYEPIETEPAKPEDGEAGDESSAD
ncbi:phosphatase [uncultured Gemmiger sp.]|mgnify:CR=1 FL=1|uniref:phosphatase n=1 Tax=uncultured Gemmiger sp. TaxID=1623490 RepID=UPI0025FA49FC|nr:phosphatase [uncultured Gemmiger sp.]